MPARSVTGSRLFPATKLRVDFAFRWWRGQAMADDELIAQQCVRICMAMEDVCVAAITARTNDGEGQVRNWSGLQDKRAGQLRLGAG